MAGAMTVTGVGAPISLTATNTANPGVPGIAETGVITGASGSSITFTSNGIINQTGAINLAANTSGSASTVTYDTTTGNLNSKIIAGALTVTAGSTSDVNYIEKSAGAGLAPGALILPGTVLLDNTYGGTAGSGGTPTSGYITSANSGTYAGAIVGVNVSSAIAADKGITLKGASPTSYYSVYVVAALTSSAGPITISGSGIDYSIYSNSNGTMSTVANSISITGASTTGQAVNLAAQLTANSITITATGTTAATIATINAMTISSTGSNISVTANDAAAGANTGITQTGAITDNASGSSISFISNNSIYQSGAITLAANKSGSTSTILYDNRTGSKASVISAGALSLTAGSTSPVNYSILAAGAGLTATGASVNGAITIDNTYGCATAPCTATTAVDNYITIANSSTLATTSANGINVTGALTGGTGVTLNGITYSANSGVYSTVAVTATTGNINVTGIGSTGNGIAASGAGATFTATTGNINLAGYQLAGNAATNLNGAISATAGSVTITGSNTSGNYAFYDVATINAASGITILSLIHI